jgi:hypothetical protein
MTDHITLSLILVSCAIASAIGIVGIAYQLHRIANAMEFITIDKVELILTEAERIALHDAEYRKRMQG